MRPLSFRSDELRSLLLRNKIATLDELKQALGTSVNVTVFRKLKPLAYLTSYSHRGRYYTLREIARFDVIQQQNSAGRGMVFTGTAYVSGVAKTVMGFRKKP